MKSYVGTKIINAEPMNKGSFEFTYKELKPDKSDAFDPLPDEDGYHVVYGNKDGEYHSWSPKEVFEEAYRELSMGEQLLMKSVMIP